jgi:hypothetical protein
MSSVQEIENINTDDLKDTPEILVSYSEELLINKKYEKAIEFREKALKFSFEKFGGENNIRCAFFYVNYADALIVKVLETQDLFNGNLEKNEEENEAKLEEKNNPINNIDFSKQSKYFIFFRFKFKFRIRK